MKKYISQAGWHVFSLFICLALGILSANAQSTTSTTGDWNTAATWGGTLPAAGATVTVSNAITINSVVANIGCAITISSGGSITMGAGGVLTAASITVNNGGTLDLTSGGNINLTGALTNNGIVTPGAGVINSFYFYDTYTRSAGTASTSMTSLNDAGGVPSVTYAVTPSKFTSVYLTGSTLLMVPPGSTLMSAYISAPFPSNPSTVVAPFNTTLANNTGIVTWYATLRAAKSSAPVSGSTSISQILASTNGIDSGVGAGNGYAVSIVAGSTTNNVQFGYYTGGLTNANFTVLASLANVAGAQDYANVKVSYNPFTQKWTLTASNCSSHTTNAGAFAAMDPTLSPAVASITSAVDTKYTGVPLNYFGFQNQSNSTNSNVFDNYYLLTTPVVNVTAANSVAAPVTTLTSLSGFNYVQSTNGPSAGQKFYINSGAITNPVTVTVSNSGTNWEVSKDSSTWSSSISYSPTSNAISGGVVFVRLKGGLSAANYTTDSLLISAIGVATKTVNLSGTISSLVTPTAVAISNSTDNLQNVSWGTVSSNILVFASTTAPAYTPSGDASLYTGANAVFGSASTYGTNYKLVFNGSGTNVDVTGLTNNTRYYYQVFSYSGTSYSTAGTGTVANGTTAVPSVTNLAATTASAQSVVSWTNPTGARSTYWDNVLILAYPSTVSAPAAPVGAYSAGASLTYGSVPYGSGASAVYYGDGTSSSGITVTGLSDFTQYTFAAYVWHNNTSTWSAVSNTSVTALTISSLNVGDFVSTATGLYNANGTWSVWNGTALVASPCTINSVSYTTPSSTSNVYISSGKIVNISTIAEPSVSTLVTSTTSSSTTASAYNLYVVNGTVKGTDGTDAAAVKNPLVVFGPHVSVSANGTIGDANTGNTSNGIEIFTANNGGTTLFDNYPIHASPSGSINLNKILLYATNTTCEIATSVGLHYHGTSNGGGAVAMGLDNGSGSAGINGTITIDNGATVTMDQECVVGPYTGNNNNIFPANFTLNVNGTLTFTPGWGTPQVNTSLYNFNGYLSLGNGTANAGTAGTGSYLHIGSTGVLNVPEFYPNGTNFVVNGSIAAGDPGNGQISGVVVDAGGQLNVGFTADFRTPGQTVTGGGSFNFNTAHTAGAKMSLGSTAGLDVIQTTGTNYFDGTASTYQYTNPTAWATGTAYILGQCVTASGNIYRVSVAGTSTTAPSGTSSPQALGATFDYVSSATITTGTKLPLSVYGLTLANASSVTLSGSTTVTNTLTQTSTVLTASSASAVLTIPSAVTQPTWSNTNYVAGPLQLFAQANTAEQTINFPVGFSGQDYTPVALTFTQASATATGYTVSPIVGAASHGLGTLGAVTSSRYYTVSAAGNSFTNGSIALNYTGNDDDNAISLSPASNIRIAEYTSGANWTDLGGTGTADLVGTIASTNTFSTLGQFAIANASTSQPAPNLTAAVSATVAGSYNITFSPDDASWRDALTTSGSVSYNGTVLTLNTDYTVSAGVVTIIPNNGTHTAALRTAGSITILFTATGYQAKTVYQTVGAGTATKLGLTIPPAPSGTADGVVLTTQPVVTVQDAYGNTVTSSSASIAAATGSGSSSYFTLGGNVSSNASSGVATFSTITAINRSTSNVTGSITFTSAGLTSVTSNSFTIQKPTTYWYVGGATPINGVWPTSPNTTSYWAATKGGTAIPSFVSTSTDIYVIDGTSITPGGSGTNLSVLLKYSNSPTIGQLIIQNGAQVKDTTTTSNLTINIAGDNGINGHVAGVGGNGDLYIDGGSSLTTFTGTTAVFNMLSGAYMNIPAWTNNAGNTAGYNLGLSGGYMNFNAGATATVSGIVNVGVTQSSASNCFIVNDASAVQFLSGSTCIVHGNSGGYPFGRQGYTYTTGTTAGTIVAENNSITTSATPAKYGIVFQSGSNLNYQQGLDVFGGSTTNPVIQMQSGSNFNVVGTGGLIFDGYTFSNLTFNNATYNSFSTGTGSKGITCDNLTVSRGTVSLPEYGTITINGNLTIGSGDSLSLSPTSAAIVNIPTATAQTINGVFTVGAFTTMNFTSSLTIASSGILQGTGIINASALNVNGTITPNTSTTYGALTVNKLNLGGGSTYYLNIRNTVQSGAAGNWDSLAVSGTGSAFTIGATSGNKDTIALVGTISSFTNTNVYSWVIGTYAGSAPSAANTVIITRGITNTLAGTFSVSIASGKITLNYSPLPAAATNVVAIDGDAAATVSFTLPVNSSLVTGYTVTSSPGNRTATGTNSPITVTGLTNQTSYTFIVTATNSIGSTNSVASNAVIPSNTTIWNGTTWSAGAPLNISTQSIEIAANYTNNSVITNCNNLIIDNNATFNTVHAVNLVGYLNNSGTITGDTIIMSGSAAQTMFGTGLVANLKINNSNGVTITSGNIGVTGLLTIQTGLLTTGGHLTLKSTSLANTAVVGPVTGTIAGNVTVERYIPNGLRVFRDLGAGGVAPTTSIFANWQEGGVTNNGYGTQITGLAGTPGGFDNASGFDYSLYGAASLYTYKSQIWDSVTVAKGGTKGTTLDPFQGFRLLIRGNRTNDLSQQFAINMTGSATLRSTGSLIYGNVIYNVGSVTGSHSYTSSYGGLTSGAGSYSFITNPYASIVDWNAVITNVATNMNGTYYYNDPTFTTGGNGVNFVGYTQFVAYNNVTGASNTFSQSKVGQYLQPGQAIFVQNPISGTPSLKFYESAKVTTQNKTAVFGNQTVLNRIALGLFKNGSNLDGAVSVFDKNFSTGYGNEDAVKFANATENMTFNVAGKDLAINGFTLPSATDVLPIRLSNLVINTAYEIKLDASQFSGNGLQAYLKDNVLNTKTLLVGSNNAISFKTTSVDVASYANRYSVVFGAGILPVSDIKLTATAQAGDVQVAWTIVGESNVASYTVQHSVDGASFSSIATVAANNSASYSAIDSKAVAGTNYYRIKVSSNDGTVSYSNVVELTINNSQLTTIAAYPNPLIGAKLNVALNHLDAGKYSIAVYNVLGAKVVEKSMIHNGGNAVEQLSINSHLAVGSYTVRVSNSNGVSYQSQIEVK